MTSKLFAYLAVALSVTTVNAQILEYTYDPTGRPGPAAGPHFDDAPAADADAEMEIPAGATAYQAALINAHNQQVRERAENRRREAQRREAERLRRMPLHERLTEQRELLDIKRFLAPQRVHAGGHGQTDYIMVLPAEVMHNTPPESDSVVMLPSGVLVPAESYNDTIAVMQRNTRSIKPPVEEALPLRAVKLWSNAISTGMKSLAETVHYERDLGAGVSFQAGVVAFDPNQPPSRSFGLTIGSSVAACLSYDLVYAPFGLVRSFFSTGIHSISFGYCIGSTEGVFIGLAFRSPDKVILPQKAGPAADLPANAPASPHPDNILHDVPQCESSPAGSAPPADDVLRIDGVQSAIPYIQK